MGHLSWRQKVLPSLVSHEISASISLLSTSLPTWETPVIRPSSSLIFLSRGRSLPLPMLEGGRRRTEGPCSKGAAVCEARGWHGHLRAKPALSGGLWPHHADTAVISYGIRYPWTKGCAGWEGFSGRETAQGGGLGAELWLRTRCQHVEEADRTREPKQSPLIRGCCAECPSKARVTPRP